MLMGDQYSILFRAVDYTSQWELENLRTPGHACVPYLRASADIHKGVILPVDSGAIFCLWCLVFAGYVGILESELAIFYCLSLVKAMLKVVD